MFDWWTTSDKNKEIGTGGNGDFGWKIPPDGATNYIEIDRDAQLWQFDPKNGDTCGTLTNRLISKNNEKWHLQDYHWCPPIDGATGVVKVDQDVLMWKAQDGNNNKKLENKQFGTNWQYQTGQYNDITWKVV